MSRPTSRAAAWRGKSRVLPLTGDASDRRYFRVLTRGGTSIVLALHAEAFDADALPFLRVAELFLSMPLPVPAILDRAGDLGILAARGSRRRHAAGASGRGAGGRASAASIADAVALIETLQRRGAELSSPAFPPYRIAFDVDKLMWELDFFTKHFLEAYRGAAIPDADRAAPWETNGVHWPRNWPRSPACCAIATTTAAT